MSKQHRTRLRAAGQTNGFAPAGLLAPLLALFAVAGTGCDRRSEAIPEPSVTRHIMDEQAIDVSERARRIHAAGLLFDGHNDLPAQLREKSDSRFEKIDISREQPELHTDIPRLRRGGMGAQFWAAFVPSETITKGGAARFCLEQIDLIQRMAARYSEDLEMAYTAADVERIHRAGRIASLIGIEGGHAIENSLGTLRAFYSLGARYMTLTHSDTHDWADAATDDPRHDGLSPFGEDVIREMNRLGMLVDISHVSPETMRDVLRISRAPVIASHSSAYAVAAHPRNVPDDVLRAMPQNGGVVMVNFFSGFVVPESAALTQEIFRVMREMRKRYPDDAEFNREGERYRREHPIPAGTMSILVDHIDHIVRTAGIDHVGLGSDYDGINRLPVGIEDVSCYPRITQALLDRGYSETDIHKIMGGNVLRVLREAERVAREMNGR